MHELASMAASKAQELHLPPPPTEFTVSVATPNEKVINKNSCLNIYKFLI